MSIIRPCAARPVSNAAHMRDSLLLRDEAPATQYARTQRVVALVEAFDRRTVEIAYELIRAHLATFID
jgi:hypothetical protein